MVQIKGHVDFDPDKQIGSLEGKVLFVTGGTAGLGRRSIQYLAKHNPTHIYFTGRNTKAADSLIADINKTNPSVGLTFLEIHLDSLASAKSVGKKFVHDRLDILMLNGGIMDIPPAVTKDGFECHIGTNHLGNAMVLRVLMPILERTADTGADVRVVSLSSAGHFVHPKEGLFWDKLQTDQSSIFERAYRYGQSMLAKLVYASELARRHPKILSVSIHPGFVATDIIGKSSLPGKIFMYARHAIRLETTLSVDKGALNQVWAAAGATREQLVNGEYYDPIGVIGKKEGLAASEEFGVRLWEWTNGILDQHS